MRSWRVLLLGIMLVEVIAIGCSRPKSPASTKYEEVAKILNAGYYRTLDLPLDRPTDLKQLFRQLDPYSLLLSAEEYRELSEDAEGEYGGIGLELEQNAQRALVVVASLDTSPAARAGIRSGDTILTIDGTSSNSLNLLQAVRAIRGPVGTSVRLAILRGEGTVQEDIVLKREIIQFQSAEAKDLGNGFVYLRIREFPEGIVEQINAALRPFITDGTAGLVVDLRRSVGGLVEHAVQASSLFVAPQSVVCSIRRRNQDPELYRSVTSLGYPRLREVPLTVLVDHGTSGMSEIFAAALQDLRHAIVLGEQTHGRGLTQMIFPLRDGSAIRLSTGEYFRASGTSIAGAGVQPDRVSAPDDPVLIQQAVEELRSRGTLHL